VNEYYRRDAASLFADTGGNTGNLAFRYAVATHLVNPAFLPWSASAEAIKKAGDVIVLPLANQLGSHTDLGRQAEHIARIGLPVIGIGLGAQASELGQDVELSEGTRNWLSEVASHAPSDNPNIGVRGEYTATQIAKLGLANSSMVMGCPSNFINLSDDIADSVARGFRKKICRVAVTAGIPYIAKLAGIENRLADIVSKSDGAYITQHGLQMVQLARGEYDQVGSEVFTLSKNYIRPGSTDDEFRDWLRQHAYAFFDVRAWMDFLRRFDFVVGTRFHGVMLAIQAGVPAGCIAHDSRTLEMCQTMGVPVCLFTEIGLSIDQNNILDYFKFDHTKYQEARANLLTNYISVIAGAGLELANPLRNKR